MPGLQGPPYAAPIPWPTLRTAPLPWPTTLPPYTLAPAPYTGPLH